MIVDPALENRQVDRASIALVQGMIFLATLLMLFGLWSDDQYASGLTRPMCIFFSVHLAWCFWSWHALSGRWLDSYSLFLLSLSLFNGGQLLLETFSLNPKGILAEAFSVATTNHMILLVNASVVACHLGGVVQCLRGSRCADRRQASITPSSASSFSPQRAREIGLLFLALSVPTALYNLKNAVELVAANGYMTLYQQEQLVGVDNWLSILGTFFVPGTLITFVAFSRSPREVQICWGLTIGYTLVNLLIGSRAPALMACLPMVLLHHSLVHRIRRVYLIGGALLLFILLPVIAQVRHESFEERSDVVDNVLTDNPFVMAVSEMGGSANTIAYTLELVPACREFDDGAGYGYALLTVVPNLFWDLHPSTRRGKYGDWLVWTVAPSCASSGGGLGFSVVAEAYANFGILGPAIVMAILGFAVASLVSWARSRREPFLLAMETIALSVILILPRAETSAVCRPLFWFCVIPYLLVQRRPHSPQTAIDVPVSKHASSSR